MSNAEARVLVARLRATLESRDVVLNGAPREDALLALAEELGPQADEHLKNLLGLERAEGLALWLRLQTAADALAFTLSVRDRDEVDDHHTLSARRARLAAERLAKASVADALRERS